MDTIDMTSGMPLTTESDVNIIPAKEATMTEKLQSLVVTLITLFTHFPWSWEHTDALNTSANARRDIAKAIKAFVSAGLTVEQGGELYKKLYSMFNPQGTHTEGVSMVTEGYKALLAQTITEYITTATTATTATTPKEGTMTEQNPLAGIEMIHYQGRQYPKGLAQTLYWVYDRAKTPTVKARFFHLATVPHPSGSTRQGALRQRGVVLDGTPWREFRLGEDTYKLGSAEWDDSARRWFQDSYEFLGASGSAAKSRGRHVTRAPDRKGYILIQMRAS